MSFWLILFKEKDIKSNWKYWLVESSKEMAIEQIKHDQTVTQNLDFILVDALEAPIIFSTIPLSIGNFKEERIITI